MLKEKKIVLCSGSFRFRMLAHVVSPYMLLHHAFDTGFPPDPCHKQDLSISACPVVGSQAHTCALGAAFLSSPCCTTVCPLQVHDSLLHCGSVAGCSQPRMQSLHCSQRCLPRACPGALSVSPLFPLALCSRLSCAVAESMSAHFIQVVCQGLARSSSCEWWWRGRGHVEDLYLEVDLLGHRITLC